MLLRGLLGLFLVASQPAVAEPFPVPTAEIRGQSPLAMVLSCNALIGGTISPKTDAPYPQWTLEEALEDCEGDLIQLKNLGVGWVRLGAPWYAMVPDASGDVTKLDPNRAEFLRRLLRAIRLRGMKVLFQVGLEAPPGAYLPSATNPPALASMRLDFDDAKFSGYLDSLLTVIQPYVAHIELLNEVNRNNPHFFPSQAPSYTALDGYDYVLARMKQLHILLKARVDARRSRTFNPLLHGTGISYDCNGALGDGNCPDAGEFLDVNGNPVRLMQATYYLGWMQNGWQPDPVGGRTILRDYMDVVDVHPYFHSTSMSSRMNGITTLTRSLAGGIRKSLWATETNTDGASWGNPQEEAALLAQMNALFEAGVLDKFFWYTLRDAVVYPRDPVNGCQGFNSSSRDSFCHTENEALALYDRKRVPLKPTVIEAIRALARKAPYDSRFDRFEVATLYDFHANARAGHWYANGYARALTVGSVTADGGVQDTAIQAEDGVAHAFSIATTLGTASDVHGDFLDIQIPLTGTPTFRAAIALPTSAAQTGSQSFMLHAEDLTDGKSYAISFTKTYTGSAETIEWDLSFIRGHRINLVLSTLTGTKGGIWIEPRLIDRGS